VKIGAAKAACGKINGGENGGVSKATSIAAHHLISSAAIINHQRINIA